MTVPPIPPGFCTVTPYIVVQGVAAMLEFVQKAFGAQVLERMPGPDGTVAHAMFRIGDSMLMCGEFREIPGMPKEDDSKVIRAARGPRRPSLRRLVLDVTPWLRLRRGSLRWATIPRARFAEHS